MSMQIAKMKPTEIIIQKQFAEKQKQRFIYYTKKK